MTDISTIKTTDRVIDILHPGTGDKLGIRVCVVSIDDDRLTKAKRAITDRRLHLEARAKNFKAEELEENKNNLLLAAIIGWEWYAQDEVKDDNGKVITEARERPSFNGEVPEFNRRNVLAVISDLPWFATQINEAIGETDTFFSNSKSN
jgi:hypothetical protein